jgi:hypothetical protein
MRAWPRTAVGVFLAVASLGFGCEAPEPAGFGDLSRGDAGGAGGSQPRDDSGSGAGDAGGHELGGGSGSDAGTPARDGGLADAATHADGSVGSDAGTVTPPVDAAPPSGGVDAGDPLAGARAQCVLILNQYRATLSPPSPPMTESTANETCADSQAQKDFQADKAHSAFGQCSEHAQDECPGWPGPPSSINTGCLAQMWAEGPPPAGQDNHWLNMSNAKYTKVACGFYQTPSGEWWTTQDFW